MTTQTLTQAIIAKWEECLEEYAEEVKAGFMKPQLIEANDLDLDDIKAENPDETEDDLKATWSGIPLAARLSASGYLDCTDWSPIGSPDDVGMWFETFVSND